MHKFMTPAHRKVYSEFLKQKRDEVYTPALVARRAMTTKFNTELANIPALANVFERTNIPTVFRRKPTASTGVVDYGGGGASVSKLPATKK